MVPFKKLRTLGLILILGLIYLGLDGFFAFERFGRIGSTAQGNFTLSEYIRQFVFISEYIIAILMIYLSTRLHKVSRYIFLALFGAFLLVDLSVHNIQGKPATISDIAVLNAATGNTADAVAEFYQPILKSLLLACVLLVPLFFLGRFNKKSLSAIWMLIPVSILSGIYIVILVARGEPALVGFPKGFSYGFGTISLKVNDFISPKSEMTPLTPKKIITADKIVVIIDESIEYQEFNRAFALTPHTINYGQARSAANCSAASNFTLRKGGWDRNLNIETIEMKHYESLFQLAKQSGYKTVYIDNQNVLEDHSAKNYFTPDEIKNMDLIINGKGEFYERDSKSLQDISDNLKNSKVFIFVNKIGAHFPYGHNIPEKMRSPDKILNYRNSLELNTIKFLQSLSQLIDDQTLVFYTSDHGQNLKERTPQCNTYSEVTDEEYSVPFLVLVKSAKLYKNLEGNASHFVNKLTHLEFSESVRNALGYEAVGVSSVFKNEAPTTENFCGLFGSPKTIFGSMPHCKQIGIP